MHGANLLGLVEQQACRPEISGKVVAASFERGRKPSVEQNPAPFGEERREGAASHPGFGRLGNSVHGLDPPRTLCPVPPWQHPPRNESQKSERAAPLERERPVVLTIRSGVTKP